MDSEEREIFDFLKTWGSDFVSYKEIARRAGGKKKYYENPDWAKPNPERSARSSTLCLQMPWTLL